MKYLGAVYGVPIWEDEAVDPLWLDTSDPLVAGIHRAISRLRGIALLTDDEQTAFHLDEIIKKLEALVKTQPGDVTRTTTTDPPLVTT